MTDAELPPGWAWSKLGDAAQPSTAKVEPSRCPDLPYVGLEHIESGTRRLLGHGFARDVKSTKSTFRRGDVLYGKLRPYLRKVWLAEFDGICSTDMLVYQETSAIDAGFLAYLLASERITEHAVQASAGINLPRVNAGALEEVAISLPPLAEQRRIVAKLDELLGSSRAARAALDAVPALLEQYRQTVLAAAFSGELTAAWRLKHISHLGAEVALQTDRTSTYDGMPALPSTWRYLTVERVAQPGTVVTYGIVLPGPQIPDGVPYVRQQDIEDGQVKVDALGRTSHVTAAKHSRSTLQEGDVLLCIIRHLRVAVVPPGIDGANITQGTVRIRPAPFIISAYLAAYLSGPVAQAWMKRCYIGMAMPRINVKDARAVPVAVPPLEEQHEIMRRVSTALSVVERQLTAVNEMRARLVQLEQSVLTKSFRGDLIPQDPDDEPASALLNRIRSERAEAPVGPSRRRAARA